MPVLLWGLLAIVLGLALVWLGAQRALLRDEQLPAGVELPATRLQRVSWWSLGAGLLLGAGAVAVVLVHGADATYRDDGARLLFTVLLLGVVVTLGGVSIWLKREAVRVPSALDERDRAILERAPSTQGVAVLLTLAVWVIGLMERFSEAGAVPVFYLVLVFWSCLVVYSLGLPVGVLLGYRRR